MSWLEMISFMIAPLKCPRSQSFCQWLLHRPKGAKKSFTASNVWNNMDRGNRINYSWGSSTLTFCWNSSPLQALIDMSRCIVAQEEESVLRLCVGKKHERLKSDSFTFFVCPICLLLHIIWSPDVTQDFFSAQSSKNSTKIPSTPSETLRSLEGSSERAISRGLFVLF